ncbi:PRC-barrel domain-containing protein [Actinophytocola glycyrrhizae]|uniref:PRC-barrel domain-containing protein n=1 Tax=Actinophytocola glycyrrhizae TaxID=2044873 RepID=A0ABV9RW28_9PSEU
MNEAATLVRLDDTDLALADSGDDVRGRTVVDANGDEVGEVDGLIVDLDERRVRLLQVASGGFLGIGKQMVLVPVDAVTAVDDTVHIGAEREHVARGPAYDPELVLDPTTTTGFYDYYGFAPYWSAGYMNPGFPYRT